MLSKKSPPCKKLPPAHLPPAQRHNRKGHQQTARQGSCDQRKKVWQEPNPENPQNYKRGGVQSFRPTHPAEDPPTQTPPPPLQNSSYKRSLVPVHLGTLRLHFHPYTSLHFPLVCLVTLPLHFVSVPLHLLPFCYTCVLICADCVLLWPSFQRGLSLRGAKKDLRNANRNERSHGRSLLHGHGNFSTSKIGGWRLVAVDGGWWLAVAGLWRLAAVGSGWGCP